MTIDVMIDLETLGVSAEAVILTVGAVKFDPYSTREPYDAFYAKLNVEEQVAAGRTIDESTIEWWSKQDDGVVQEALGDEGRISMEQFYKDFNKFLVGVDYYWSQGTTFDIVILEHFYKVTNGWPIPWHFWKTKDSRTILSTFGDGRRKEKGRHHNAVADAYDQAIALQEVFQKFMPDRYKDARSK